MKKFNITVFPQAEINPSNSSYGIQKELNCFEDLHELIQEKAWSPAVFKESKRSVANFLYADLIALDFDEGLTVEEAKARLEKEDLAYSITFSRHHQIIKHKGEASEQLACDRFRVILILKERAISAADYLKTLLEAQRMLPELDPSCLDAARFFFPSTGGK
jgi:hypothetical protein